MSKISFYDLGISSKLIAKRKLIKFLHQIFKEENTSVEKADIIFCTDKYLLSLNRNFLAHNFYTDTLTFPLSNKHKPVIGEIYISVDRVRYNSKVFGHPFQNELVRVIIHSVLHLCGYQDKPLEKSKKMILKQEEYLKRWSLKMKPNNSST